MVFIALRVTTAKVPSVMESHNIASERNEKVLKKDPTYFHSRYIKGIVLPDLREYLDIERCIVGEECLDPAGRLTHLHYHIHIETQKDIKKDTLQKHCREAFDWKGKEMYAVQLLHELDGEGERWWRYPLKEKLLLTEGDFSDMDLEQMALLAKDEKARTAEIIEEQKNRDMMKNQFRDKLMAHFKKKYESCSEPSNKDLWCQIAKYYYAAGKTPPFRTLDDLVDDVRVFLGYMTIEDLYDIRHNS